MDYRPVSSLGFLLLLACGVGEVRPQPQSAYSVQREAMVDQQLAARDIRDRRVLQAMREVPRHAFVPEQMRPYAYADHPLPIGQEQTISQPYIVALMTQLAEPGETDRALEIGTGSGYQAAVLSRVVAEVFTIEIIPDLARSAEKRLMELDYRNIQVREGDGYLGWPEQAPFDIILLTAAAPRVPEPLIRQLAEGGRMVLPLGSPGGIQELLLYRKKGDRLERRQVIPVRFVPMTGQIEGDPN